MRVDFPEPRIRVEPRQAVLLAAVVVCTVAVWAVLRPEPAGLGAAEWGPAASSEAPVGASEAVEPEQVVVSVVGEVERPGLVTLGKGARVADALLAAGPKPEADLLSLNQAQLLADGQQIVVLAVGAALPPSPVSGAAPGSGLVSLNTASAQELTQLPGVGEATAEAIVAHREANGPFTAVDGLLDVKGIGPAKFAAVKDLVSL